MRIFVLLLIIFSFLVYGCVGDAPRPAPEGVHVDASALPTSLASVLPSVQATLPAVTKAPDLSVVSNVKADTSGALLVEYRNEAKGYTIQKPSTWNAVVQEDQYLLVSKDENTDALIWPLKLSGQYAKMNGLDLGNYIIGLIKAQYSSFKVENIHVATDKSSMQVVATLDFEGVSLKTVMTTFVDANGNGLLAGYEAPITSFEAQEPVLRAIITSYKPVATDVTKAAVGAYRPVASSRLQLVPYSASDGGFSVNIPSGWKVDSLGSCSTKSMVAYDVQNPVRRIFAIASNTYAIPISQPTSESVILDGLGRIGQYDPVFTAPSNIQLGSKKPYPATQGVPGITDAGVFDVTMTIDGQNVAGSVGAYVLDPTGGYGSAYGSTYYISLAGTLAEAESFDSIRETMDESIKSFQISQTYANQCSAASQSDINARTGDLSRTLSETSDIITSGYNERSQVQDRVAQKWSDTTLGVDRVYDPTNDAVYQVPNGFYDQYDINRNQFEKNNLQELSPDQWNQYAPLDGALNIR